MKRPPYFRTATPMLSVTSPAGSARQAGLLKIISICTTDLKDDLQFLDLKLYMFHSINTDMAKGQKLDQLWLPENEAILEWHKDDMPNSYTCWFGLGWSMSLYETMECNRYE